MIFDAQLNRTAARMRTRQYDAVDTALQHVVVFKRLLVLFKFRSRDERLKGHRMLLSVRRRGIRTDDGQSRPALLRAISWNELQSCSPMPSSTPLERLRSTSSPMSSFAPAAAAVDSMRRTSFRPPVMTKPPRPAKSRLRSFSAYICAAGCAYQSC